MCITVLAHAGMTGNGPDERVTRVLMGRLDDSAAQVRLQTIMTIAQLGKPADPNLLAAELRAMRAHMNDRDKTVAIWAHLSMMALDKIDDDDIKFLTQNTQTSELQRLRFQAVGALGMVGTKEKKVVPTLIALLKDEDAVIVAAACQALGGIGDPGEKAETALIAVANDQKANENVRVQAIYALASIGMKGKNAVPALIALFDDKDPNIVMTACHGIGLLDEPNGLAEQALMKLSQDGNASEMVRKYAKAIMESLANAKPKK